MTGAGLNTVNLSTLNAFQQLLLFFLIVLGSPVRLKLLSRSILSFSMTIMNGCRNCHFCFITLFRLPLSWTVDMGIHLGFTGASVRVREAIQQQGSPRT
ncbi:uncharacterized protein BDW43DRAFT_280239 [Aspergillus alliaceus]|uniref:uncharacterized protein n=1 Tax=Petromyces alliaceus TaxID=209559 RepID=UPI0012A62D24|nr:uncharacterized protein BDW43DRAFT_280239 [Aspergillus alliaceus]KAB8232051.1 hypothetical protein BDW43DRAFT_280239 [Aspergillus alliaceus]